MPEPAMDLTAGIDAARAASVLACVTFHFRDQRLPYLFEVLRNLAEFPVHRLDVTVLTNAVDADALGQIRGLCAPLFGVAPATGGKSLAIESFPDLADPWDLAWCHKTLIATAFLAGPRAYSHFLYTEDDVAVSFASFCYFIQYREAFRAQGLIPGFLRVELNPQRCLVFATDQTGLTRLDNRAHTASDGFDWMNMENPYQAAMVLDQDLAREHVQTRSFDRDRSQEVMTWGRSERAAMGLIFEHVPKGFYARTIIPVRPASLTVPSQAWVYHLPANYTVDPAHPAGKLRADALFSRDGT